MKQISTLNPNVRQFLKFTPLQYVVDVNLKKLLIIQC